MVITKLNYLYTRMLEQDLRKLYLLVIRPSLKARWSGITKRAKWGSETKISKIPLVGNPEVDPTKHYKQNDSDQHLALAPFS